MQKSLIGALIFLTASPAAAEFTGSRRTMYVNLFEGGFAGVTSVDFAMQYARANTAAVDEVDIYVVTMMDLLDRLSDGAAYVGDLHGDYAGFNLVGVWGVGSLNPASRATVLSDAQTKLNQAAGYLTSTHNKLAAIEALCAPSCPESVVKARQNYEFMKAHLLAFDWGLDWADPHVVSGVADQAWFTRADATIYRDEGSHLLAGWAARQIVLHWTVSVRKLMAYLDSDPSFVNNSAWTSGRIRIVGQSAFTAVGLVAGYETAQAKTQIDQMVIDFAVALPRRFYQQYFLTELLAGDVPIPDWGGRMDPGGRGYEYLNYHWQHAVEFIATEWGSPSDTAVLADFFRNWSRVIRYAGRTVHMSRRYRHAPPQLDGDPPPPPDCSEYVLDWAVVDDGEGNLAVSAACVEVQP